MSQSLLNLSYVVVNNSIQFKMDKIADIFIHGLPYFSVFRRYNSPYEIVVEDMNGDTYLYKDQTVRESLQSVLCLSSQHAAQLYTNTAHSYKHNAPLSAFTADLADWHWSEIQNNLGAVWVDFGGILLEFQEVCEQYAQQPPHTPVKQDKSKQAPQAPQAPHAPRHPAPINLVDKPKNEIVYQDSIASQETQYSEDEGTDYIVLRSGTHVRKAPQSQKPQKSQKKQKRQ